jgi:hypothetical protein
MPDETPGHTSWSALSDASPEERVASMTETFTEIATLEDAAAAERIAGLLNAEASFDDKGLQAMAASRLRALSAVEVEPALRLQAMWDDAEKAQPANLGMRRVFALQAAAKGLSLDEVSHVERFLPTVRQMAGLAPARSDRPVAAAAEPVADTPAAKKGFLAKLFSRS